MFVKDPTLNRVVTLVGSTKLLRLWDRKMENVLAKVLDRDHEQLPAMVSRW